MAFAALWLASCGGGDDTGPESANSGEKAVKYESYAKDVQTSEDAIKLYTSRMNQIADAIEAIETNADADRAAQMIMDSAKEYELLDTRLDELGRDNLARDLASRDGGYMNLYTRQYADAQARLGTAMQKVAEKDPRMILKLSRAMQKMNTAKAY